MVYFSAVPLSRHQMSHAEYIKRLVSF